MQLHATCEEAVELERHRMIDEHPVHKIKSGDLGKG
jgi:hypothetical protein